MNLHNDFDMNVNYIAREEPFIVFFATLLVILFFDFDHFRSQRMFF